jgi:hypothetical protein
MVDMNKLPIVPNLQQRVYGAENASRVFIGLKRFFARGKAGIVTE